MSLMGEREESLETTGLLEGDNSEFNQGHFEETVDETKTTLLELSRLSSTSADEAEENDIANATNAEDEEITHTEDADSEKDALLPQEDQNGSEKALEQKDRDQSGKLSVVPQEENIPPEDDSQQTEKDDSLVNTLQTCESPTTLDSDSTMDSPVIETIVTDVSASETSTTDSVLSSPTEGKTDVCDARAQDRPSKLLIPDRKKKDKGQRKDKKAFSITSPSTLAPCSPLSDKTGKKPKSINVAVFVKEGSAKLLMLERGKHTTAGEIKKMMIDNLSLPSIASTVFAVWLTSPHLELQLKDHHVPFMLRKQWPALLEKFAMVSDDSVIGTDEPVLLFQRNAFLSIGVEKRVTDANIIKRLYEEAKYNVLKGKYPVPNCDGEMLGGFVARLENGKFDPESHKIGYFRNSLPSYLPQSCRGGWFTRSVSVEQKLIDQYSKASDRVDDPKKLHRLFLEYCWTLPFYGCTFFKGKVEQQSKLVDYKLWKGALATIYIGINRQGITIFKDNRREILLTLGYDELSWDCVPSKEEGIHDSFCIEYDTVDENGRRIAKQLQVFSQQAVMMDAMVDSCVNEMNRLKIPKSPTTPAEGDSKLLADEGPPYLKRDRKSNFSLSNPFKVWSH